MTMSIACLLTVSMSKGWQPSFILRLLQPKSGPYLSSCLSNCFPWILYALFPHNYFNRREIVWLLELTTHSSISRGLCITYIANRHLCQLKLSLA
jgi:hypothetical protein